MCNLQFMIIVGGGGIIFRCQVSSMIPNINDLVLINTTLGTSPPEMQPIADRLTTRVRRPHHCIFMADDGPMTRSTQRSYPHEPTLLLKY